MQYADIALPVKTRDYQDTFTYRIPPALLADISIGRRVKVSFHRRELVGTIIQLRTQPPRIRGSIKEIINFADPLPLITSTTLELAKSLSRLHGASLGQMLEAMTPKPAVRVGKRFEYSSFKNHKEFSSDIFGIYEDKINRYNNYLSLIQQSLNAKKTSLVIFPDFNSLNEFQMVLNRKGIISDVIPPVSELTGHYEHWLEAITGKHQVVLGIRKAIFLPLPNLRLIIIDQVSEYGYKEEQYPYYHVASVAKQYSKLSGSHLVLGDAAPRLTEWLEERQGKLKYLKTKNHNKQITLVDTSTNKGLLPEVLKEHIESAISSKKKVIIYFNRKGEARYYHCLECENAFYCPKCDSLLGVKAQGNDSILNCTLCGYQSALPYRCDVCMSYKLGQAGMGTERLAKILGEHFPSASISVLDKNQPHYNSADIVVATNQLFFMPKTITCDVLITFQTDQQLHGTAWNTYEEAYLTLGRLLERTSHLIIKTSQPDNHVIQSFQKQDIDEFYTSEFESRKRHKYPPAFPLIQLSKRSADKIKLETEALRLYENLRSHFDEKELTTPYLLNSSKNRYTYQILIRAALSRQALLSIPPDWHIDPEPMIIS